MDGLQDSRPVPDPTTLTTEAIRRDIEGLEKRLESRIEAAREVLDEKVLAYDAKVKAIEAQRIEAKADNEKAIDRALEALKAVLAVQTEGIEKQLDRIEKSLAKELDALRLRIDELRERIEKVASDNKEEIASVAQVANGQSQQQIGSRNLVLALVSAVTIIVAAVAIFNFLAG